MSYLDLTIEELHKLIIEKKVNYHDLVCEAIERAKASSLNGFVTILEEAKNLELDEKNIDSPLFGIPFGLKDNFSTKGIRSTGCSNILKNYVPVFDATAYTKLKEAGAIMIGKTTMDELAMGGTGTNANNGVVHNPYDYNRITGGSSSGSAAIVASGIVPFAIGSDTGDSVRKPAGYCGIVGFKPTYGRISRFGLFPFAPSLDHVAFFTRSVKDASYVLEALQGNDEYDATCSTKKYSKITLDGNLNGVKIATIEGIDRALSNPKIIENYQNVINKLIENGATVTKQKISFSLLKAIYAVYMVISCAEATSNNANLDGIKFGLQEDGKTADEVMMNSRTKGFGELIKRRFILGSYVLAKENQEALFLRAQKVRHKLVNELHRILKDFDAILTPFGDQIAPLIQSSSKEVITCDKVVAENHLSLGNFSGMPSITIPSGFVDNMPVAVNIMGEIFEDEKVLNIAYGLEKVLGYKNLIKKEDK